MAASGFIWIFLVLLHSGQCQSFVNFTNTIICWNGGAAIAAIPGEQLTVECTAGAEKEGLKTIELRVNSPDPVHDTKFDKETQLVVNKTIEVNDEQGQNVSCNLSVSNETSQFAQYPLNVSWIEAFTMEVSESIEQEDSIIDVTCSIPDLRPEPKVTLRYQEREFDMITTNRKFTKQLNMTKTDNGQLIFCCLTIPKAGKVCKNRTLDISFPPQDMTLELKSDLVADHGTVTAECRTSASNPPSTIAWTRDFYSVVKDRRNISDTHNGWIVFEMVEIFNISVNDSISCKVTNGKFPDWNLNASLVIPEVRRIDSNVTYYTSELWVLVVLLVGLTSIGIVCLAVAGTIIMGRGRRRHQFQAATGRHQEEKEQIEDIPLSPACTLDAGGSRTTPGTLVYADLDHSPSPDGPVTVRGRSQQVEYVTMAFPPPPPPLPDPPEPYAAEIADEEPDLYCNYRCESEPQHRDPDDDGHVLETKCAVVDDDALFQGTHHSETNADPRAWETHQGVADGFGYGHEDMYVNPSAWEAHHDVAGSDTRFGNDHDDMYVNPSAWEAHDVVADVESRFGGIQQVDADADPPACEAHHLTDGDMDLYSN